MDIRIKNMFIKLLNNYFEEPMHCSAPPKINICRKCNKNPEIFSMRERQDGYRILLIGINIRCNFCNESVYIRHSACRSTIHPDDSTVHVAITKWNEANEKDPMPLRKRIAL